MNDCPRWVSLIVGGLLMSTFQLAQARRGDEMSTQSWWDGTNWICAGDKQGQLAFIVITWVEERISVGVDWQDFKVIRSDDSIIELGEVGTTKGVTEVYLIKEESVLSGTLSLITEEELWSALDEADSSLPVLGQLVDILTSRGHAIELKLRPWKPEDPDA